MEQIIRQLKRSRYVFVTTHIRPDGDAIGALIAMGLAMTMLDKHVIMYCESAMPPVYRFLPAIDTIVNDIDKQVPYDTAIVLDCGDIKRVGEQYRFVEKIPTVINIDHHVTNTAFGQFKIIETTACATTEILYRLIKQLEVDITPEIAIAIYTGIFTDTGSFRFSNTNKSAFAICDEMVAVGVNPYTVAKHVYGPYSLGRIKLLNMALDSIEISGNGKLSMMTVTREMFAETGTYPEDTDGLINYARRIEDVKVAVLIQEQMNGGGPDLFHVSLRSDGSVDVAAIAADYGGGGHPTAAGFNIRSRITDLKSGLFSLAERI